MTKAHDCLVIANEQQITMVSYLKRILRTVAGDDVTITFVDGSRLIYCYTQSWRQDRLIVDDSEAGE